MGEHRMSLTPLLILLVQFVLKKIKYFLKSTIIIPMQYSACAPEVD